MYNKKRAVPQGTTLSSRHTHGERVTDAFPDLHSVITLRKNQCLHLQHPHSVELPEEPLHLS